MGQDNRGIECDNCAKLGNHDYSTGLQVAKAGETAIKQIGSVVRNPEIQVIAPSLIDALQNPTKKTSGKRFLNNGRTASVWY